MMQISKPTANRVDEATAHIVDTAIFLLMTLGPATAGEFLVAHEISAKVAATVLSDIRS